MSVQSLSIHDDAPLSFSESTPAGATSHLHHITATSSDFTKNLCARPFEAKRSILKGGGSRPVAPAKPEAFVGASTRNIAQRRPSNEDSRMLARVAELEKVRKNVLEMNKYLEKG